MKTVKQLLRQPVKTAVGIVMVALAFAVLVVCVGQYTATDLTRENLDDRYTTIGLLSDNYFWSTSETGRRRYSSHLPKETQEWIERLIYNRTDIINTVSSTGLISAYIPNLNIDNFSQHLSTSYNINTYNTGHPYRGAMLTVKLTKVGAVGTEKIRYCDGNPCLLSTTYLCVGTVESVVSMEQGFDSPVGKTIVLQIRVYPAEKFAAMDLQVGETYLVYGQDFCDQKNVAEAMNHSESYTELFGELTYTDKMLLDTASWLEQFDCTLTLFDPSSQPTYLPVPDEQGNTTGWAVSENRHEVAFWNKDHLELKRISTEEFVDLYQSPTIAHLNTSVEEFLASEDGALWREELDKMEINNHAFPVLGVEKLGYQALFSREQARITEGRDFSESELLNGEKVCIIAESLAEINGLQIGDTIDLQTYFYDPTYEAQNTMVMWSNFPSAAIYSEALGFSSEMETYTIVGLYRLKDAWQNAYDMYGFTPNTIFVPKSSVTGEMLTKDKGIYSTLVLHNGTMDEFKILMNESGYPDLFICYDQGYSEFMASLDAYEEVSQKALYIGITGFAAVILLFLFLYPAQQKRSLRLMGTLGAPFRARLGHIFGGTLCILIPGAVLGGFAGEKLWHHIAAAMMEWINVEITLNADMSAVAPKLTAAGIAVTAVLALIVSIAQSRNRGLMKRR